ncbi:hypothetical protein CDIK_3063 [Cucumispora dikerogammari]|nr:hypothetical protein CDIK_3063 [Cucumispora dikerogammari]
MTILGILRAVFVIDNVPFHKCTIIKQTIESAGHYVLYLLPYSFFLDLFENFFSKWKQIILSLRSENEQQLFNNIENAAILISAEDRRNYYRHMLGFLQRCIREEEIID